MMSTCLNGFQGLHVDSTYMQEIWLMLQGDHIKIHSRNVQVACVCLVRCYI